MLPGPVEPPEEGGGDIVSPAGFIGSLPPVEEGGGDIVSPAGFIGSLPPVVGGVEDEPPNDEAPGSFVLAGQRLSVGVFLHSALRAFFDMGFGLGLV
jgi:hypothetical protein